MISLNAAVSSIMSSTI